MSVLEFRHQAAYFSPLSLLSFQLQGVSKGKTPGLQRQQKYKLERPKVVEREAASNPQHSSWQSRVVAVQVSPLLSREPLGPKTQDTPRPSLYPWESPHRCLESERVGSLGIRLCVSLRSLASWNCRTKESLGAASSLRAPLGLTRKNET